MSNIDERYQELWRQSQAAQLAAGSEMPQLPLFGGGGGGTSGGMETWQQSVDRRLAQAEADARGLLKWGIGAVVALAAMIGGLYLYVGSKNEGLANQITSVQVQQAHVEDKLDRLIDSLPKK